MYNKKVNKKSLSSSHGIQKRGISAIVATVLIILITVAAVTILWAAVIPLVRDNLESGTVCLDASTGLTLSDSGYTCVNTTNVSLQIKHGAKAFDVEEIQVLIYASGDTTTRTITTGLPGPNEEKVFLITHGLTAANIEKVEIAPVVLIGNTKKTCDVSASIAIKPC